jgi:hypothetical protein
MALPLLSIHLLRFLTYFLMRILDSHGLSSFQVRFSVKVVQLDRATSSVQVSSHAITL